MTCKCDLELQNQKFSLNIDLSKLQDLDLYNADKSWPGQIGQYPEQLTNLGNNIYATRRSSHNYRNLSKLQEVISDIKNSFLCDCLKSKIDLIKFVLTAPEDSGTLRKRNAGIGIAAGVPKCNNIVMINTYNGGLNTLDVSTEQLKKILTHEIIHLMDGCYPCRSKTNNDLFNQQRDSLYRQYRLIYKDIKNFHKEFTSKLVNNNIIKLKSGVTNIIDGKLAFKELDYALTDKYEFLAVFSQFFCFEMAYNTLLIDSSMYTIENPNVTEENLRALYILEFNQRYKSLIQKICELYNKIQSDPDNCNESLTSGIECSLSLSCGSRTFIGLNLCCNSYDIHLDIDSDAGCCNANKSDQKKNPIYVGSINLVNECKCYYRFDTKFDIDLNLFMRLINNCCNGTDLYPINNKDNKAEEFKESLRNQIYDSINGAFGNDIQIFKNIIPCN